MQKLKLFFLVATVVLLAGCTTNQNSQTNQTNQIISSQNCVSEECLAVDNLNYPVGNLEETVVEALNEAIQDEYKAWSTYDNVIEKFGSVRPFIMIIRAEEQHISSLKSLFDKYGLDIPTNDWSEKINAPESLSQACAVGVEAEIANAALYQNKLIPMVKDYPDITQVFNNLMSASENSHLSAFEKCK